MNLSTAFSAGRLTIYLQGELDQHEARSTSLGIDELIDEYVPRDCVLDLSALSFMDSSGIAVIVRTANHMKRIGGRTWIENPLKQALRVIDASGVDRLVPVETGRVGGLT
ncbi:MAG: STAS domain-containing protein [Oscillospiraceae bacterium]|nr:STAS domain-containing protein [Oscillospiraceae bacterium]